MNTIAKYGQGHEAFNRPQSDIDFQRKMDERYKEEARRTLDRFEREGRAVRVKPYRAGLSQGIGVLPNPVIRDGFVCWTVR